MKVLKDWIIAHKLLSIIIAAVVVVGATSAVVLPIALAHKHEFSAEWVYDGENHWHVCAGEDCDETDGKAAHVYDNDCDETCNVCGATRTVGEHVYDNVCDETCNICGATRTVGAHVYDNACDTTCNICGATRTVNEHVYDNACDTTCNVCGATRTVGEHAFVTKKDTEKHWQECSACGYKTDEKTHSSWDVKEINTDDHVLECQVCGHLVTESHTYENDTTAKCDSCSHERTTTTLAFKSGMSYTSKTYNGQSQAFDKQQLVSTNVSLDDVIVEYSESKTDPVWITDPKDAGEYFIRLRVEATDERTACTVDNFEETGKKLTITSKTLSLTDLVLIYKASELNTNAYQKTINLTSADISGLCGSDTLQVKLYKNAGEDVFADGEEWVIESIHKTSDHAAKYVGIQGLGNYKFDPSTTGKLYITKSATYSEGDGTNKDPDTYTAEATIAKNGIVYYSADLHRPVISVTGGKYGRQYNVTLSNSNAKIVDVYVKETWLSLKLTADGTWVIYGAGSSDEYVTMYIVVKYEGTDGGAESITNTLTVKRNYAFTNCPTDGWEYVLDHTGETNTNHSRVHVTLKEDGNIIEECKIDPDNRLYYRNYKGTEVYYITRSTGNCYKYSKDGSGNFVKESMLYGTYTEADEVAQNATKFTSNFLRIFATAEATATFTFSNEDQMYLSPSYVHEGVTYTNIALKFDNNCLIYAEYEVNGKKYTLKVEYENIVIETPGGIDGKTKEKAITVPYTTDNGFSWEDSTLYEGDNWFVINITSELYEANKKLSGNCDIEGAFTTTGSATLTITADNSSGTILTNSASGNGNMKFTGLSAGKYYIKITASEACTGSLNIKFNKGTITL